MTAVSNIRPVEWERPQTESGNSRRGLTRHIGTSDRRAEMHSTRPSSTNENATVGRHFTVNWEFVYADTAARSYVYEVYEPDPATGYAAMDPVYVGMTDAFPARWNAHRSKSWWMNEARVLCVILSGYTTRAEARRAEAALIGEHRPVYNTKPERRHLRLANELGVPDSVFTAELTPTGWDER